VSLWARARAGCAAREAAPRDVPAILEFLDRRPAENVFLSYLLRRDGAETFGGRALWHLAERDGEPVGACLSAANVVPAVADEDAARTLAARIGRIRPGAQSLVGERAAVNALWEVLARRSPRPRLVREEQPFYVLGRGDLARAAAPARVSLRRAGAADLDPLVEACAAMLREEILDDPHARDPAGFRAGVWRMIAEGAIFVGEGRDGLLFKAHANVRTPLAVQISGVYTMPGQRRRGHARACLRALAALLLEENPTLCLYVNGENRAAIRTYEAVGFRRTGTFKTIFFAGAGT
jgi:predicted GNAT family acetyltransferase